MGLDKCTVTDCNSKRRANGLCRHHYNKLIRKRDPKKVKDWNVDYYGRNRNVILDRILLKRYGITREQWNILFQQQNQTCAICRTDVSKGTGWQTDHNHSTGKLRGILCNGCNSLLGWSFESVAILENAIAYLKLHGEANGNE